MMIKFICERCKKPFERSRSYVNHKESKGFKIRFCSTNCHTQSVQLVCENCHKPFKRGKWQADRSEHHFCSRSCAISLSNTLNPRIKKIAHKCEKCGEVFEPRKNGSSTSCCSICVDKRVNLFQRMTVDEYKDYLIRKYHESCRFSDRVRYLNRSWNKDLLKYPCQFCGYAIHVHLSHKKAIHDFSGSALLSDVNSPDNNIVLCSRHHWEYDNGLIPFDAIPKRVPLVGIEPTVKVP